MLAFRKIDGFDGRERGNYRNGHFPERDHVFYMRKNAGAECIENSYSNF